MEEMFMPLSHSIFTLPTVSASIVRSVNFIFLLQLTSAGECYLHLSLLRDLGVSVLDYLRLLLFLLMFGFK